jgi:reactive intermediate/imine deaminase
MKKTISTSKAPAAIGSYSQAVQSGNMLYLSGQIPLEPNSMQVITGGIESQIKQVFENLQAIAQAANSNLNAIVKLTVYLTDINHLAKVNEIMPDYFEPPFPARTSIAVSALPKGVQIEIDAIMELKH